MAFLSRCATAGTPTSRVEQSSPGLATRLIHKRARPTVSSLFHIGFLLALVVCGAGARAQESLETAVKASYLYKFAPFVNWPIGALDAHSNTFNICVVGVDPFGSVLDRAIAGQRVDGRAIVVRRMPNSDRNTSCQIMFVGGPPASVRDALRAVARTPVLTVTDGSAASGIVDFVLDHGRVRFRLDDQAAAENGLTVSSKLLSLAVSVRPRKERGGS